MHRWQFSWWDGVMCKWYKWEQEWKYDEEKEEGETIYSDSTTIDGGKRVIS